MPVLRFFFAERFTRFDSLVIVLCTALYVAGEIGFFAMLGLFFGGFGFGLIGQAVLSRAHGEDIDGRGE